MNFGFWNVSRFCTIRNLKSSELNTLALLSTSFLFSHPYNSLEFLLTDYKCFSQLKIATFCITVGNNNILTARPDITISLFSLLLVNQMEIISNLLKNQHLFIFQISLSHLVFKSNCLIQISELN